MNRREILMTAAGLAALPTVGRGQTIPCPPPTVTVAGGTSATTSCESGNAPDWFAAMSDRTWIEVAAGGGRTDLPASGRGSRLADVAPSPLPAGAEGQRAVCNDWTGGCADQARGELILAANGGHNGYYGNEVYALALRNSTPNWVRLTNPTPNNMLGGEVPSGGKSEYLDGRMRAVHGYNRCCFGDGKVWYAATDGAGEFANITTAVYSFDRASLDGSTFPVPHDGGRGPWTFHGIALPGQPVTGSISNWATGPSAYDRVDHRVWSSPQYSVTSPPHPFFSVNTLTGAITTYPSVSGNLPGAPLNEAWSAVAHDLRVWVLGSVTDGNIKVLDLTNPTAGFVTRPATGTPTGFTSAAGAVYHQPSRALLVWHHSYGASVRKLTIPANPLTGTYTWTTISPASANTVSPPGTVDNDFQGIFSKFNMIEDMGDGRSALCLVARVSGSAFVYKLPPSV